MSIKLPARANKSQWLKIGFCILGVLMIAGAVTYEVLTRQASTVSTVSAMSTTADISKDTRSLGRLDGLNWVNEVNAKFADKDFLFVMLPGNDDLTQKMEQTVSSSTEKMAQDGVSVSVYSLGTTDLELTLTAKRLSITDLPTVLLFSSKGRGAIISGDITEKKILEAYFTLQQICIPSNSGCCPK